MHIIKNNNVSELAAVLSLNQRHLWRSLVQAPMSPIHVACHCWRVRSELDPPSLFKAWSRLAQRYPVLRSVFYEQDGEPWCREGAGPHADFEDIDARNWSEAQLQEHLVESSLRPFDLEKGPLTRLIFYRRGDDDDVLLLAIHELLCDSASLLQLIEEWGRLYVSPLLEENPPNRHYKTFVEEQREALAGESGEQAWEFWQQAFANGFPALNLPVDHERTAERVSSGAVQAFNVDLNLTHHLKLLAEREGVSVETLLLATFLVLLQRHSDQDEIMIGTCPKGSRDAQYQDVIGYFANPMLMIADCSFNPSFRNFLHHVHGRFQTFCKYRYFPLEEIGRRMAEQGNPVRWPPFQAMFVMQESSCNLRLAPLELGRPGTLLYPRGMVLESRGLKRRYTAYDISLTMAETPSSLAGLLVYKDSLFDSASMERFQRQYTTLLESIVADADQSLSGLNLLSREERRQMDWWNDTSWPVPRDQTIHQVFERRAALHPDAVMVVHKALRMTYRHINGGANRLAHYLRSQGVGADSMVGVCVESSPELIMVLLGILKAGGAYVPLDPDYPRERLSYMTQKLGLSLVVSQSKFADRIPLDEARILFLDRQWQVLRHGPSENPEPVSGSQNLAYVNFTSGSTGNPKGVLITHRNVIHLAFDNRTIEVQPGDNFSLASNTSFDAITFEIWMALLNGGRLTVIDRNTFLDAAAVDRYIANHSIDVMFATTALFNHFARTRPTMFKQLKYALFGGEQVDAAAVESVLVSQPSHGLVNCYGPTEGTVYASTHRIRGMQPSAVNVPIGKPIANAKIYLLDPYGNLVPVGGLGELCIGGGGLARGYYDDPDLTAERFVPNPFATRENPGSRLYRTGDLARRLPSGELQFHGRRDHQVKIRGFRIELVEVEAAVASHEQVREVVVLAPQSEHGARRLIAYFVPTTRIPVEAYDSLVANIRAHLKEKVPSYMIPAVFVVMERLPLTPNGKLDRKKLPEPDQPREDRGEGRARNDLEQLLLRYLRKALGIESIGIHDDFFEMGGDSIRGLYMLADANRVGLPLTASMLFEAGTVAKLAERFDHEAFELASQVLQQDYATKPVPAVEPITAPVKLLTLRDAVIEKLDEQFPDWADIYPLTVSQAGMLFHSLLEPESQVYHDLLCFSIETSLEVGLLREAWSIVIAKHEALRTLFFMDEGKPYQVVLGHPSFDWELIDGHQLPATSKEGKLAELQTSLWEMPFDLTDQCPYRIRLIQWGEQSFQLMFAFHHIILDGWSVPIILKDLAESYRSLCLGVRPKLESKPPFRAYIEFLNQQVMDGAEAHWRQRLLGFVEPNRWPRGVVNKDERRLMEQWSFSTEQHQRLEAFARKQRVTLNTLFQGAWALIQTRHCHSLDVVFGVTVASRPAQIPAVDKMTGMFLNTLPLRTTIHADAKVGDWLRQLQSSHVADREYETYSLLDIQAIAGLSNQVSLFESVIAFENFPDFERLLGGGSGLVVDHFQEMEAVNYPLALQVVLGDGIRTKLLFDNRLFEASMIADILEQLAHVLMVMCDDGERLLESVTILPDAAKEQIVSCWSPEPQAYPREASLEAVFDEWVKRMPTALAVESPTGNLDYQTLDASSDRVAATLIKAGVKPYQMVGIAMESGPELVVGILGIIKAGAAFVPLDSSYPSERLRFMIEDADLQLIMVGSGQFLEVREGVVFLHYDDCFAEVESVESAEVAAHYQRPAYVMYTSGSTGNPKGVLVSHHNVLRLISDERYIQPRPGMRIAQVSNTSFDAFTFEMWTALLQGGCLCMTDKQTLLELDLFADFLSDKRIDAAFITAALFKQMAFHRPDMFQHMDFLLFGGERADPNAVAAVVASKPPKQLINGYGPTESTTFASSHRVTHICPHQEVPIGRPIANTWTYILDFWLHPLPTMVPGELFLGGEGLAMGYWRRPALTAERFIPNPFAAEPGSRMYRTGDLARFMANGVIDFIGRNDRQVKLRGFRIELGEIEAEMLRNTDVKEALVRVYGDDPSRNQLAAYVVPKATLPVAIDEWVTELKREMAKNLPAFMVPAAISVLNGFPLTANGKLDARALPNPFVQQRPKRPQVLLSTTQAQLAKIWRSLLSCDVSHPDDHFFELGGHSLLAIQLSSRIRDLMGADIPLKRLFECATLGLMSTCIDEDPRSEKHDIPALVAGEADDVERASFAQERLWVLDRLTPGSYTYNIPVALALTGALDVDALASAVAKITDRHEVLRTCFVDRKGIPYQRIMPTGHELSVLDLSPLGPQAEAICRQVLDSDAHRAFDLAKGPLVRFYLLKQAEGQWVLLVNIHHVIADGWSMGVLIGEINAAYVALVEGGEPDWIDLPVQYRDYSRWQRGALQDEYLERQLSYWERQLVGAPPSLELPLDFTRPPVQTYNGRHYVRHLPSELLQAAEELCRVEGVTLYMALLGCFSILLSRYSGQDDISVGSPVANRGQSEVERLIGFFVNTLVFRVECRHRHSFKALLHRIRHLVLEGFDHQEVPFEQVVDRLQPERDTRMSPLFQALFAMEEFGFRAESMADAWPGLKPADYPIDYRMSKFDLSLLMSRNQQGLTAVFEYNTDLFSETTIARMAQHFETLLTGLVANPADPLQDVVMLDGDESRLLLRDWNDRALPFPEEATLPDLFEQQVARTPFAPAVEDRHSRLTYEQLNAEADRIAAALVERGVGPGHLVGVCMQRSTGMIAAMIGILKSGAGYVPLDPDYPAERIVFSLEDSQAKMVIGDRKTSSSLEQLGLEVLIREDLANHKFDEASVRKRVSSCHDLAYVLFTSGSTGRPKGVAIAHRAVSAMLAWAQSEFSQRDLARVLAATSICFDLSVYELFLPLTTGGTAVVVRNALSLLEENLSVTLVNSVPSAITELVRADRIPRTARVVNLAGEPLPGELVKSLYQLDHVDAVYNLYGPSEDTTYSTCAKVERGEARPPIGCPLANSQAYLVDPRLNLVALGCRGELLLGGAGLARGYLNRPSLTAERFIPDAFGELPGGRLYRTGDLVRYRHNGSLDYLGRLDHQVKLRGFRIELDEIQARLKTHERVREAVVQVRPIRETDYLVAYVVFERGCACPVNQLKDHLAAALPHYMVPSAFEILEFLPLTPNGKLDRKALPEPSWQGTTNSESAVKTATEQLLEGIWSDVLAVDGIQPEDRFFSLGGHSLLATQVTARIRDVWGIQLPLIEFFEHPDLRGLAARIDSHHQHDQRIDRPSLTQLSRPDLLPLSFAQERLWLLDRMQPNSAVYNLPLALRIEGGLDGQSLMTAIDGLSRRHDALRTRFIDGELEPIQIIESEPQMVLNICSLEGVNSDQQTTVTERFVDAAVNQPFDLGQAPLMRVHLLRLNENRHVLIINTHHIISDGWSLRVLLEELSVLYCQACAIEVAALEPLPVQYADFSLWQRGWLRDDALESQLTYWRTQLSGAPSYLTWTPDFKRPMVQSYRGRHAEFWLDEAIVNRAHRLCRETETTPFMLFLSVYGILLGRYARQTEVCIGSPIANRHMSETERLFGFFVNTLVYRLWLDRELSFKELLAQVRDTALGAYVHQDVPFEKVVEHLNPERDTSRSPIFQVLFAFENLGLQDKAIAGPWPGLMVNHEPINYRIAKFDVSLFMAEDHGRIRGSVEYNTDLYGAGTIERFMGHYLQLLESFLDEPEQRLNQPLMAGPAEMNCVVEGWTGIAETWCEDDSIVAQFENQVHRSPGAVALVYGERNISYFELNLRANQLASYLRGQGIVSETRVGLALDDSLFLIIAMLAILKSGGTYVPLDGNCPPELLDFQLKDAEVGLLLTKNGYLGKLPIEIPVLDLEGERDRWVTRPFENLQLPRDCNQLAYVMFTSGSTGRPKGVEVMDKNVLRLVKNTNFMQPGSGDVFLQSASVSFDAATFEIWGSLLNGAKLILAPTQALDHLADLIAKHRVTHLWLTSQLFNFMVEEHLESLEGVETLIAGGEALSVSHVVQVIQAHPQNRLLNGYGPTENTTFTTTCHLNEADLDRGSVPIGKPIHQTEVFILEANLNPAPLGVVGDLYTGGEGLARGYHNRASLTAENFIPHPFSKRPGKRLYRTGDLARFRENGELEFHGRGDQQVKLRGFRIELEEIEHVMEQANWVDHCRCLLRRVGGERQLVAYVVLAEKAEDRSCTEHLREKLRGFAKDRLPKYAIPTFFVVIDSFPVTQNGKLDVRALPLPEALDSHHEKKAHPVSDVQRQIHDIWQTTLASPHIGIHDNFFDLGGHSILVAKVHRQIEKTLVRKFSMMKLFEFPTIAALAQFFEREKDSAGATQEREKQDLARAQMRRKARGRQRARGARHE